MVSLKALCPPCATVHLSNVLLAVGWFGQMHYAPVRYDKAPQRAWSREATWDGLRGTVCRSVAIAGAVIGTFYVVHSPDTGYVGEEIRFGAQQSDPHLRSVSASEATVVNSTISAAAGSVGLQANDESDSISTPLILGSVSGQPVSLFVNFTCEKCARISQMLDKILEQYPGRLCIQVHLIPLEQECNPAVVMQRPEHVGACQLARLGYEVAGRSPQQYQTFHLAIAALNGQVHVDETRLLAERVLGHPMHQDAAESQAIEQRLQQDIDLAIDLGINNLPTIVINGRKYEGCPERESTLLEILLPLEL